MAQTPTGDIVSAEFLAAITDHGYNMATVRAWLKETYNVEQVDQAKKSMKGEQSRRAVLAAFMAAYPKRMGFDQWTEEAAAPAGPTADEQQHAMTISHPAQQQMQAVEGDYTIQQTAGPFTEDQIGALDLPLDQRLVKKRAVGGGRQAAYVTGATVFDIANTIFGYGMWGYAPAGEYTYRDLPERQLFDKDRKPTRMAHEIYVARDITVWVIGVGGERSEVTDRGSSVADLNATDPVGEFDRAEKAAITDGVKRGFLRFGGRFGNDLRAK